MDKNKVFISYAREDSEIAQKLYDDLKEKVLNFGLINKTLCLVKNGDWTCRRQSEKALFSEL
ncbi:MAG: toll/interleukin-1 receptor domain-containing protein [Anaerolineales bacterium]|uniref:hypothetical protein n=1 Tax=Candidatus Villigracilis proximus TaxID=3140683 RepID=UPI003135CF39|nr:toll/interleukin-1 receptor domain-containing protein [Anaerolineales bacterium]